VLYRCPHPATYVSSYFYICVLILLHMCPHTSTYVSSSCYICVLILLHMCPHTTLNVSSSCYMCVLISVIYASAYYYTCRHPATRAHAAIYASAYYYICVLILLYMCPHPSICVASPAIYVSACCYIFSVRILLNMRQNTGTMGGGGHSRTAGHPYLNIYVSSSCYIWALSCFYVCGLTCTAGHTYLKKGVLLKKVVSNPL